MYGYSRCCTAVGGRHRTFPFHFFVLFVDVSGRAHMQKPAQLSMGPMLQGYIVIYTANGTRYKVKLTSPTENENRTRGRR